MSATPRPRSLLGALLLGPLGAGCAELDNPYRPYPEPPWDGFVAEVQPLVASSCADLGCHGSYDRRLTLFAEDGLRGEPAVAGTPLEARLTDAELGWNYDSLRLRLVDEVDAERSFLVLKCVDPALGGIEHADGVVIFDDLEDPDYLALRDWVEAGL